MLQFYKYYKINQFQRLSNARVSNCYHHLTQKQQRNTMSSSFFFCTAYGNGIFLFSSWTITTDRVVDITYFAFWENSPSPSSIPNVIMFFQWHLVKGVFTYFVTINRTTSPRNLRVIGNLLTKTVNHLLIQENTLGILFYLSTFALDQFCLGANTVLYSERV